jgi:YVTN family beta-propeller protein|tara:strand:+ start:20010 stop:21872 length:1863 start_codon:yes stop_codon:yes gene_type:complete
MTLVAVILFMLIMFMKQAKRTSGITRGIVSVWLATGLLLAGAAEDATYRSPSALCADSGGVALYIAQTTTQQVAAFDLETGSVKRTIPVPGTPADLVLSPDASRLYVALGEPEGRIAVVNTASGKIVNIIPVGHTPSALAISPEGGILYVCNRFNNRVAFIDLGSGKELASVPVAREPVAAVLSPDGQRLFVANHIPAGPANGAFAAAELSVIDTKAKKLLTSIPLHNGSTGVNGLCLSPDGNHVYATHTIGRYHVPATQLERGWVNTNALSVIDAVNLKLVNAVLLDNVDRGAANPWGVACTSDGKVLAVTHSGSHEVSIIDRVALHEKLATDPPENIPNDLSFMVGLRQRVKLSGLGPRELVMVGSKLYTAEYFSDSIGIIDLDTQRDPRSTSVALGEVPPMTVVRRGEFLFKDASWCFQQWQSCVSCHPSDRTDALNWDLLNDGLGTPKNTKSLVLAHQTPPTTATAVRANAEISVRAGIRFFMAVRPESDAVAIDEYLKSLKQVPSPRLVKGQLSPAALRGKKVFEKANCALCHKPPLYTNMKRYDIGTGVNLEKNMKYDVPTLIEIWRNGPYLHDGRATSIRDVVTTFNADDEHGVTTDLTPEEITDLIEFVESL